MGTAFEAVREREATLFLPVVKRLPAALVRGRGSRVWDVEGREYIDLTGGWGVTAIGHCHPRLVEAIAQQAGQLMQTTNLFYTLPQLDLAQTLCTLSAGSLSRTFFTNCGTEAMDGALKLAHRATGRSRFVATTHSFHGRSLGALSILGQSKHRDRYAALLPENTFVPFGDLEAASQALGSDVAAFVVEPIQGEGGVNVPPDGYLRGLRELCHRSGALLLLDEIQTGIGRTGRMFAFEYEDAAPDILTLGKGLGGGFPLAAFLCSEAVAKTVQLGDHGGTYAGNPLACAAGNAVLAVIEEDKLVARSAELGEKLAARLTQFAKEHPELAEGVRGRGLLQGLVLRDAEQATTLPARAIEKGVLANVTAERVLRLFPALNIPEDDLWPALETLFKLIAN